VQKRQKIRKQVFLRWLALLWLFTAAACLPEATPMPTPTPTATATITPTGTATIVWFPPTATPTPFPTLEMTPTLDLQPVLGDVIFEDTFTDTELWSTTRSAVGSVAYGKSELTLAVSQPKGTLISLRKTPELRDFYLEMDAQPSLCRGADMYGLLLRAASGQDFYRLMINCSGQLRMERVKDGRFVVIQDWTASGQFMPGGMLRARIGVSAQGKEFHIFINDVLQFSFQDPVFERGALGVFARSAGETPLTVSFSDLVVSNLSSAARPAP
jgi:hypothetical protein